MNEARFNPLKVLRWHGEISEVLAGEKAGPIRANLDLTNVCNHGCEWCEPLAYREQTIQDKTQTIAGEVACEVLEDLASMGCKAVYFSGGGEPTLHKDFGMLVWRAFNLGMKVLVISNGSQLKRLGPTFSTYVDHVRFSIDASNEDEHMAIHHSRKGDFAEFSKAVGFLHDLRDNGRPEIGIAYSLEVRNDSEESIERVIRLAEHEWGVDYIQFRPVSRPDAEPNETEWQLVRVKRAEKRVAPKRLKVLAFDWRAKDVFTQREFSSCYSALTVAVIGANGDVQACCDNRAVTFGNVYKKRFKDIWLSQEHRFQASNIEPKLCPRCLQCGYNKAVESFIVRNEAVTEFV